MIQGGDPIAIATGGLLHTVTSEAGGGEPTATPTISVTASGTTATVSVGGEGLICVMHKSDTASDWTTAPAVASGEGVELADLDPARTYAVSAYATDAAGENLSHCAPPVLLRVTPAADDVTPTGVFGSAIVALQNMIASSEAFQTAIGAIGTDAEKIAQAKQRVHIACYKPDGEFARPFALISRTEVEDRHKFGTSAYGCTGQLELAIEADIPESLQGDAGAAELWFANIIDGMQNDILAQAGQPGKLYVDSFDKIDGPYRYQNKPVYGVEYAVRWDIQ